MDERHPLDCARQIRRRALAVLASAPTPAEFHQIAEQIHAHCDHTRLKSHRLAQGWTVHDALSACRSLACSHRDVYGTLVISERSWKGWEAGDRPSPIHQDLLCRLFCTNPVHLGFARDYSPQPAFVTERRLLAESLDGDVRATARHIRQIADTAVHESSLDRIDSDIGRLARHYVSRPLAQMYDEIRDLRVEALELIEANRHPHQTRRLHLAAARLCGLQAHVCLDIGRYDLAETTARASWTMAETAGHADMLAWTRALQSLIAYWDGRLPDALAATEIGLADASGATRVRVHALRARAAAGMGNRRTTLEAIAAAEDARPSHPSEEHGIFGFPVAKCHVYAGTALLSLQEPTLASRATGQAQQALALYRAADPLDRSSGDVLAAQLDLASAYVAERELEAAQEQLSAVFAAPSSRRTASIVQRAATIENALTAHDLRQAAAPLREQLRSFYNSPARLTIEEPHQ